MAAITKRTASRLGTTYTEREDVDARTADVNSTVLRREGSTTPCTFAPAFDCVDFEPMTSTYRTPSTRYEPRQVYPAALLPLPPMFPTQLVTVTNTGMPWFFIRSTRALSLNAEMKLTTMMMAKTTKRTAAVTIQKRSLMWRASGPRRAGGVEESTMTVRLPSVNAPA